MSNKPEILIYRYCAPENDARISTLANHIHASGFNVRIVCAETSDRPSDLSADISLTHLGLDGRRKNIFVRLARNILAGLRLRRIFDRKPSAIYVIDSWSLPSFYIATLGLLRYADIPMIYHTFDWLEPSLVNPLHLYLESKMSGTSALNVNADESRARLQQEAFGLKHRPVWLPNYFPAGQDIPAPDHGFRATVSEGCTNTPFILIYPTTIGNRESAVRMSFELINAFAYLPENYRLVLFKGKGDEIERCKDVVARMNLTSRVFFFDPVPLQKLMAMISASDIGAVLYDDSKSAGYYFCNPDKLSLYALCGIPYIASTQPCLQSVTLKHGLGYCVDPHDATLTASTIRLLAEGTPSLGDMKKNARKVYIDEMHFEKHASTLIKKLKDICAGGEH